MTTSDASRLFDRLRQSAIAIAERDFGYPVEPVRFEPPSTHAELESLAQRAGAPLPRDYEAFLQECGGFAAMDIQNGYALLRPSVIRGAPGPDGYPHFIIVNGLPQPVIAVAADGGGNAFFLGLEPPYRVWMWDHELGTNEASLDENVRALTLVAVGFNAFLERVATDWEHFLAGDDNWHFLV